MDWRAASHRSGVHRVVVIVTAVAAMGIAAWALVDGLPRNRAGERPARAAPEVCPRDALPLGAGAVSRSVALVRADARRWIRSGAQLEVVRADRAVGSAGTPECDTFGRRVVVVWLRAPAERTTWEFVVYRAPGGYRIWRASACGAPADSGSAVSTGGDGPIWCPERPR